MKHLGRDIVIKDNVIPSEKCKYLIELFEENEKLVTLNDDIYDEKTQYLDFMLITKTAPNLNKYIEQLIKASIDEYKYLLNIPFSLGNQFEQPKLMKFRKEQDLFDVHFDGNGVDHPRTLVLICYLNDVNKGGELVIPSKEQSITVKPKQGRLLVCPTDWTHYHYVNTPKDCDRYSLITFLRY